MPLFIPQHFCLVSQRLCRQYLLIKLYPEKQIPHSSELLCCPRTWGQYYVIYWWPYVWTHLSSVHLHIFLCWTSRGRSQNRYVCSPAHLPLLKVKGPFTNSKHLSTCTFPSVELRGAVHKFDTSAPLHISSVELQGVVHKLKTSVHLHISSVELQGVLHKLKTSVHLHISSVELQGAVHKLDTHISPPAHFPALARKRAVSATHFHWPNTSLILLPS